MSTRTCNRREFIAKEYPYVEACFFEGRYADGWCTIPNWVGCTDVDWERIDKNRIG